MEKLFNVGVKGIIHTKEGYLLLRKMLGNGDSFWDVPGGRINGDESFEAALMRELTEELPGVNVHKIGDLEGVFRVSKDIKETVGLVLLYFSVEADFPQDTIVISDEHESFITVNSKATIPTVGVNSVVVNILEKKFA